MKKNKTCYATRLLSLVMLCTMLLSLFSTAAFAVSGSAVAADGVYYSTVTADKYKYGKYDKSYSGTLFVEVSDGEISGLWISSSEEKMSKLITTEVYYTYVGTEASQSAVQNIDAVSSASIGTSSAAVNSSVKKQYISNLNQAVVNALANAPARSSSSSSGTANAVKTVQGTASVSDAEGSKLVLDVGLDANGKIVSLTANGSSIGSWDSILSKNASDYIGKTAFQIDAVTSATQYSAAVNTAVIAALSNSGADSGAGGDTGNKEASEDAGKTISADGSATIYVGESVTLDGTHNSLASSESWSSSDTSIATVASTGDAYDSDATVTGVAAGTVTITHTISTLLGNTTESYTITVLSRGGDSSSSSGGSGSVGTSSGITSIRVTKEWREDAPTDRPASVTVGIFNGPDRVQTLTLNAGNNWTATATGLSASESYTVQEDAVEGYSSVITQGETTSSGGGDGWTAQSYGAVEAGKTYAFTYTSNGTTYLLGRSGTSVIGTTSGLNGGVPSAIIGNDYKWEITKATSETRYGEWLAKNLGNNCYLAPYNGYSTGYSNSAVLQSSNSYYGNVNLHFDDDGSIWNGYGGLNLYASGATVGSDSSSYTVFTPYLYSSNATVEQTANYTITNTLNSTGGGTGGGGTGGGEKEDVEPNDPAHVKAISPEKKVSDSYTITLNVTGQSKLSSSTTQTGETITTPYDVLLVLDNTRSMTTGYGNTTRLAAMKSAAQSFVSGLPLADGSKIAMISFTTGNYNSIVTTNVSWTELASGENTVSTQISGLNAPDTGYDTYFTQPLERASSLLDGVANDGNKKYVVFFTDGAAAESVSTIQSLASNVIGKADATFSIGIVSGSTETQKAQALASSSGNYYDVTTAGTMGTAFASALTAIQSETTVTKLPMTGIIIEDTLSKYVELNDATTYPYGVTLKSSPLDGNVTIGSVTVDEKKLSISLVGTLTDDTVYTVSIPVKPSQAAQDEANENDDDESSFVSNADAKLTYQYGTEAPKTIEYGENPKIVVAKKLVTLTYDANAGEDEVTGMPEPAVVEVVPGGEITISDAAPSRNGYTFLGWADAAAATEAVYEDGDDLEVKENKTIYAVWQATFTVTWMNGDKMLEKDENVARNTKPSFDQETEPIKEDVEEGSYTFMGWSENPEADYAAAQSASELPEVTENVIYYAIYRQNFRLILEDYTNNGAQATPTSGNYYAPGTEVTLQVTAPMATVLAIHEDGNDQTVKNENGIFTRLYCTAGHEFSVTIGNADVYVVLAYKGDIDLDGSVDLLDAALANKMYVGLYSGTSNLRKLVADVDGDGTTDLLDAALIDKSYVGLYTILWDVKA